MPIYRVKFSWKRITTLVLIHILDVLGMCRLGFYLFSLSSDLPNWDFLILVQQKVNINQEYILRVFLDQVENEETTFALTDWEQREF